MCGTVSVTNQPEIMILMEEIGMPLYPHLKFEPEEKLFPYYKPLLAGFVDDNKKTDTALMHWGWLRDWDTDKRLFNSRKVSARGQLIWDSPVWGQAIRKRRCLIPINAFYEWNQNQARGKRDRYRIELHEAAMTLGGIFEISADGEMFLSICTTEPNEKMSDIHHRMPVIIKKKDAQAWLESDDLREVDHLMRTTPAEMIRMVNETQYKTTSYSLFDEEFNNE